MAHTEAHRLVGRRTNISATTTSAPTRRAAAPTAPRSPPAPGSSPPTPAAARASNAVASDAGRGPRPWRAAVRTRAATALPARRTVEIRGRTVPAPAVPRVELDRRRPPRRPIERVGAAAGPHRAVGAAHGRSC